MHDDSLQELQKLKMSFYYLLLSMLLAKSQVITGFNTSYYKILSDPQRENFSYFSERCMGKLYLVDH